MSLEQAPANQTYQQPAYDQTYGQPAYGQTYDPAYQHPASYDQQPAAESSGFDPLAWSPQAIIFNQVKCMAIGIVVFMILMWLLSMVPLIGPIIKNTILRIITKLAELAGIAKCGFTNDFDDILAAEDDGLY